MQRIIIAFFLRARYSRILFRAGSVKYVNKNASETGKSIGSEARCYYKRED